MPDTPIARLSRRVRVCAAVMLGLAFLPVAAPAGESRVAVATNFLDAAEALAIGFETETGHRLSFTAGATGKLYAQIVEGAPFDVFLAADQARPERLVAEGLAEEGSQFTYATGRLALWSAEAGRVGADGSVTLAEGDFRALAIANPDLAPYGVAASETLGNLGLWEALTPKIVMGQNIGQTLALVATGNAELGLVALAALQAPGQSLGGSAWEVPLELHSPIRQDAVLLTRGHDNQAARAFLEYLQSPGARGLIASFGYGD
ncbi:molybdate ABC transporter substrate-binding protein [Limibaculum sp. M0105]|uniref:Molybdate ABC transporter substrate-binding protein n=1 Tax=Thermohalobaculum xanthum TaxID=2753746 RepID=A0A8J7M5J4_9RHOB|nr:molybdate ABC transporter substrate-binding protein [Thermohalobaculum xanthum]MBK0398839.1 molybdate ABC transporter substrate-binding protein [Thermohalobaculum xanthum]